MRIFVEEGNNVTLGFDLSVNRARGSGFWIHWYRSGSGRNYEIPVLFVSGDIPDLLSDGHISRQKGSVTLSIVDFG